MSLANKLHAEPISYVTVTVSRLPRYKAPHEVRVSITPDALARLSGIGAPSPFGDLRRMPQADSDASAYVAGAEGELVRPLSMDEGITFAVPHLADGDTPHAFAERVARWAKKLVADRLHSVPSPYVIEITR